MSSALAEVQCLATFTRSAPSLPSNGATASNSYQDRVSASNRAEFLFEYYCAEKDYLIYRVGFDEKHNNIDKFYYLNPILRNLPDYVVNTPKGTFVVMVKGTANIKQKEMNLLPDMIKCFDSEKAKLVYAFCFLGQDPKLIYPEKVMELYKNSVDKVWNDGVVYRTLDL
jgi:hypothetical protein